MPFVRLAVSGDVEFVTLTPLEPFFFRLKFASAMGLGVGLAVLLASRLPGPGLWTRVSVLVSSFLIGVLGGLGWILATMDQMTNSPVGEAVQVRLGAIPIVWMPVGGILGVVLGSVGLMVIRGMSLSESDESRPSADRS
jgi:hypothetical protein